MSGKKKNTSQLHTLVPVYKSYFYVSWLNTEISINQSVACKMWTRPLSTKSLTTKMSAWQIFTVYFFFRYQPCTTITIILRHIDRMFRGEIEMTKREKEICKYFNWQLKWLWANHIDNHVFISFRFGHVDSQVTKAIRSEPMDGRISSSVLHVWQSH